MKKNKLLFQSSDFPGADADVRIGLWVKKKLYSGHSPFQKIEFYDTYDFGRILVLDGLFQTSERDEFFYHEMLCHLPMFYHPHPQNVLIIGGGDGGAIEEVLKHPVKKVWMVEIDKKVIDLSKKYLPKLSNGALNSERAEIIVGDGVKFIKQYKNFFDVIIFDLSDPEGPAKKVISLGFYRDVKKSLKKPGVISVQGGCLFDQSKLSRTIFHRLEKVFPSVVMHKAIVPLYGLGELNFTVAANFDLRKVTLEGLEKRFKKMHLNLKYYRPKIHFASAVLPRYLLEKLRIK